MPRGRTGTRHAPPLFVVRDFRQLIAWQLAHELECEIFELTLRDACARDFEFKDQIRDSSASAPSNIAEGFGRFRPREFARFLEFAKASLAETRNHLISACERQYIPKDLGWRLSNLALAAERATTNLMLSKRRQADERTEKGQRTRKRRTRRP